MRKSKKFTELSEKIEVLSENAQGQLRGGFAVISSSEFMKEMEDHIKDINRNN